MKKPITCVLSLILAGCSTLSNNNIAGGYVQAYQAITSYFNPEEASDIFTPQQIAKIPYASMLLTIGKGSPGLVILESKVNENNTWVSADGVYFMLNKGRIVKVEGLENNLIDFRTSIKDLATGNNVIYKSYYSYDQPELFNLEVENQLSYEGEQNVELFMGKKVLHLYQETIHNRFLGWKERNLFWVDDNGFIWKSVQYVSPKLPPIKYEVTKKPT